MKTEYERWSELVDREAIGERLTAEERLFCECFASAHPECRAELAVLAALSNDEAPRHPTRDREVVERALSQASRRVDRDVIRPGRLARWAIVGTVAAAAAAVWIIAPPEHGRAPASAARAPAAVEPAAVPVLLATGEARVGDRDVTPGQSVPAGAILETGKGSLCVGIDSTITVCLGEDSRLVLRSVTGPERRVELARGSVAAALGRQPAGRRFSVLAGGVPSTAVGTAFSVELDRGATGRTTVYEGKVLVGDEDEGEIVSAHDMAEWSTGAVRVRRILGGTRSRAWSSLEQVTGRVFTAPVEPEEERIEAPSDTKPALSAAGRKPPAEATRPALAPESEGPAAALARARDLRRNERWAEAAAAYRQLQRDYPKSPEARTVHVSLGELELERLGNAAAALVAFDAYLSTDGPLTIEATLGRIRALRALGRRTAEAEAIERFLAQHPQNLERNALEQRLNALKRE